MDSVDHTRTWPSAIVSSWEGTGTGTVTGGIEDKALPTTACGRQPGAVGGNMAAVDLEVLLFPCVCDMELAAARVRSRAPLTVVA